MPITSTAGSTGVSILISGRFDFNQNEAFRKAYESHPVGTSFVVDLARVQYVDSSALGMLLLLRKHAGNTREGVTLTNGSKDVMRVLEIARFDQMFRILSA
ncbi:MAG: STAS domain-containing protein [Gemmatimonadota bacterium]|nr:STAS domain-containing protein [Gemmatimonadota bacterium]